MGVAEKSTRACRACSCPVHPLFVSCSMSLLLCYRMPARASHRKRWACLVGKPSEAGCDPGRVADMRAADERTLSPNWDSGGEASELEGRVSRGLYYTDNQGMSARDPTDGTDEYLQELERIGTLVSEKRGREVIYRHSALIEVLTS